MLIPIHIETGTEWTDIGGLVKYIKLARSPGSSSKAAVHQVFHSTFFRLGISLSPGSNIYLPMFLSYMIDANFPNGAQRNTTGIILI